MPTFRFTFTDGKTIDVIAPDAAGAEAHVKKLQTLAEVGIDKSLAGKALAGTPPQQIKA